MIILVEPVFTANLHVLMEENKFLNFLSKHWSKCLLSFLAFACVAAWGERWLRSKEHYAKKDFFAVSQVTESFRKGEPLSLEALQNMDSVLKRHPELKPNCDALLSYMFFSQKNIPEACLHATATLHRVKDDLAPPYQNFSRTTLLINEGKYEEALKGSIALQEEIKNQTEFEKLSGANLLRIFFLAKMTSQEKLQKEIGEKLQSHPSFLEFSSLFKEGSLSLKDYLLST